MTIGELAKKAGVKVETVRFYEKKGLLWPTARRASGYRVYDADALERIRFTKRTKELGFSLEEIKQLLELRIQPDATCADVRSRAKLKLVNVQEKLKLLRQVEGSLLRLVAKCEGSGPTSECPIIDEMTHAK